MDIEKDKIEKIKINYQTQEIQIGCGQQIVLRPVKGNGEKIMLMAYLVGYTTKYPVLHEKVKGFTWKWVKDNVFKHLGHWGISTIGSFRQLWYSLLKPDTWNDVSNNIDGNEWSELGDRLLERIFVSEFLKEDKAYVPEAGKNATHMYISDGIAIEIVPCVDDLTESIELLKQDQTFVDDKVSGSHDEHRHDNKPIINHYDIDKCPHVIREFIIPFESFIEDWRRDFCGRYFVFETINKFISDKNNTSGYLLIHGSPGIGKSSIIAELIIKESLFAYHFNIATSGINTHQRFIENICARLIANFSLPYKEFPRDYDKDGVFLNKILYEASAELKNGEKIIIAIDALDEVEQGDNNTKTNPLYLPLCLPKNIYCVMTSRNKYELGLSVSCIKEWHLKQDSRENHKDVCNYIKKHISEGGIREWIKKHNLSEKDYVELMWNRSEGNFMYLRHMLPAIVNKYYFTEDPAKLPRGLRNYYRNHWSEMTQRNPQEFEENYQPVICILAAAQEPISLEQISEWTKINARKVKKVIREWWEYLHVLPDSNSQHKYRIYHKAFQDFIREEIDRDLTEYHKMISDSILKKISNQ